MKSFETSTEIVPLLDAGTYWGQFEYEQFWYADQDGYISEGAVVCDDFNHALFGQHIAIAAEDVFAEEKPLKDDGVVSIKVEKMISPKYYNFRDDELALTVEVEDDFLDRAEKLIMAPENEPLVSEYIKEHWKSRDGFMSLMPCQHYGDLQDMIIELKNETSDDSERAWGSVLALVWAIRNHMEHNNHVECVTTGPAYLSECLYDKMRTLHSLGEYCTIIEENDLKDMFGKSLLNYELDAIRDRVREQCNKYKDSGVSEEAKQKAEAFSRKVCGRAMDYLSRQQDVIASLYPNKERIKAELDKLREKLQIESDTEWKEYWR